MAVRLGRLKKECQQLLESPPVGVSCWPEADDLTTFTAVIFGEEGTVYDGGVFKLEIEVPEKYPFQPPNVRFVTKIYHPNIDSVGRICLDVLKLPPNGSWRPMHNLSSVLTSVRLLMASPNPNDPLMTDIAEEYQFRKTQFEATAREWTLKFAKSEDQCEKLSKAGGSKSEEKRPLESEEKEIGKSLSKKIKS
ncbi:ubiquitin-conjugating enzyme E2 T-like [Macrobrachium rosenbergii]|uniref:ubiquitin-conjugating enzyme E2 T-like n=1 Tax=Macrobrachium rosenbergii TaxID=79674 RepID=UPI0034D79EA7